MSVEKIKPLRDRVLVERLPHEEKTEGGLYIPEAAKEKTQTGKVIAVGDGKLTDDGRSIPVAVKAGDTVFFGKYAGTEAGKEYVILREDEILGVVTE